MVGKELTPGVTGATTMENLKRARGEMTYAELARRLAALGRPIPSLGLRRIEAGERRVDVDDLMALAVVLGVSPLALLLPHGGQSDTREFADKSVRNDQLWQWAIGERPLDGGDQRRFQADSLPPWLHVQSLTATVGRDPIPAEEFDAWWQKGSGTDGND
ncbi:helix-turn-helix domain-containing protein [Pseudarthrobacter sp. ATCC 49987]|uniref:helix-turn-helix domain-containing protein n=1 Tax=Pseudarthrobacter sp. ATCC 49987 TaxID=2698204 RepID=UPI00192060FD|nr:helix-turn-helix transcriptional regulator [Pseudarthrobacter sp. ATCC 49987]